MKRFFVLGIILINMSCEPQNFTMYETEFIKVDVDNPNKVYVGDADILSDVEKWHEQDSGENYKISVGGVMGDMTIKLGGIANPLVEVIYLGDEETSLGINSKNACTLYPVTSKENYFKITYSYQINK